MIARLATLATNRIYNLPILVLMPHSRCNCRCIMCDIWKANTDKRELEPELIAEHIGVFKAWKVREVVLSGGEALMHKNLWRLCDELKRANVKITLLSTGLLLEKHAEAIVQYIDNVIISLDGPAQVHDRIRNIPDGYLKIKSGIASLRNLKPDFRITARCVLQRLNFGSFIDTVRAARAIGFDQISFLAADVSSSAFNHIGENIPAEIALTFDEANELEDIFRRSFLELKEEYGSRFIAESQNRILRISQYYKALAGTGPFPKVNCNAPWVSAVIEANGDVMPCFFHKPYGNIYKDSIEEIINSEQAITFRKNLNVGKDRTCARCVCSLKLGVNEML